MRKNSSQEAYYERLRNLADVNKKSIKESQNRSLGTLIDYKRAADGVAYGIVKENHHYYVKKSGLKQDPNISDFAYIDGLANITNYQYKSLAEADKQRNMLLHVINEATTMKVSKTGSKQKLNEDKVSDEIEQAEEKLDAAEIATDVPAEEPAPEMGGDEMPDMGGEEPAPEGGEEMGGEEPAPEMGGEEPAPEGGEEMSGEEPAPEMGGEEMGGEEPAPEMGGEEMGGEEPAPEMGGEEVEKDEATREIEKSLGKLTNTLRKTELTDSQVKSYVNTFLSAFKDKFPDIEIEDRKAMAEKITKVVPDEDIEDLEQNVEATSDNEEMAENEQCVECGSFAQYAESRGYTKESLMECGEEEMGNLVSGYANAYTDGENEGDHKTVALFIKLMPKVLDILKNEYGHEEYANELEPEVNSMDESTEEDIHTQINELFGGLKSAFGKATQPIKQGAQAVKGAVQKGAQAVGGAVQKGAQAVGQYGTGIKQAYHAGEVGGEVKKLENLANNLGQQVAALNTRLTKAGKQPVNVNSILTTIKNQVGKGGTASLAGKVQEEMTDTANTEINFAPEGQSLGGGVVKPDGAPVTTEEVNEVVKKLRETINVLVNEAKGGNNVPFTKGAKIVKEEKPSAGLTSKEKSDVVKKAKKGEDIGKKGKSFKDVEKKAEESGADDPKAVAAAAMWKGVKSKKHENETKKPVMSESEQKLRKYIRTRLEEKIGNKKPILNENKKSDKLKKLDEMIDNQFKLYENVVKKK